LHRISACCFRPALDLDYRVEILRKTPMSGKPWAGIGELTSMQSMDR
jgi:hypothetical protein